MSVGSFQVATLLYCFNAADEVLLMQRAKEPNRGLWSPCGGKVEIAEGESPYACACREAEEELGWKVALGDLHLTGVVSECGAAGTGHWLMFLFEVKPRLERLPPKHREGAFAFFAAAALTTLPLPRTDRETLWPMFWKHRGGFFAAHCRHQAEGDHWVMEESRPAKEPRP